jgi:CDGSH-type Zn-finger protein
MGTFISSLIIYGFAAAVLGLVGKLIYDIQQTKKENKQSNDEFEAKEQFQKLAGIGQPKNEIDPEIWKYIANKVSEEKFPEPDPSIPVKTTKITTIDTNFGNDNDPLASVPMSRVSKEAKQKMAEIAKEDISIQLEQNAEKFATLTNQTKCGCGRSETGFCTGLHRIPKKDWAAGVREIPAEKPKRKTTKKTK